MEKSVTEMGDTKSNIKFTVIIPTRERADTLEWSLKTCTAQTYENFEILVSDNFSADHTREMVEANPDKRIRYINTGERMSMTGNYEFALRYVTGDYVCIIGDDDGLMPNALEDLNRILSDRKIEAISWKKPVYIWNQHFKSMLRNTLQISLKPAAQVRDAEQEVRKLLAFNSGATETFNDLACLYHGFVKRETIDRLRTAEGQFFQSELPDVYASLVISCAVKNLYQTEVPYTLHGISKHSSGYSAENTQSVQKFLSEFQIPSHPNIKIVPFSYALCTAECILKIKDNFPGAEKFELNIEGMTRKAMEDATSLSADNYQAVADAVRFTCRAYEMPEHAERVIAQNPNRPDTATLVAGYNLFSEYLILKLNRNVKNVYDATLICKKIVEKKLPGFFIRESGRFLFGFVKNHGVRNTIGKGLHRFSAKIRSAS